MPASRKSDEFTGQRVHPKLPLPPIILLLSSNRALLEKQEPPPALPRLVSPSWLSLCCCIPQHTSSFTARLWPRPWETCQPGLLCMSTHSHTQTHTLLLPRLSPQGSGRDRLMLVPRCTQPPLLSLALPQPSCQWESSAGSLSDSEFLWDVMCPSCPSP